MAKTVRLRKRKNPEGGPEIVTGQMIPCEGVVLNEDGQVIRMIVADEDIGTVLRENRGRRRRASNSRKGKKNTKRRR